LKRRTVLTVATGALAGALAPSASSAHSISGVVNTPLPFVAYIAGAAVAVGASFVIVALGDPGPPRDASPGTVRVVPRWLRIGLRTLGLLAWLWVAAQALIGGSSDADVSSLFLWVYGWVGLAIVSAFIGPAWSWIDPFSTLYDLSAWAIRRLGIQGIRPQPLPVGMAYWPAVVGFCFFVWLELVPKVIQGRLLGIVMIGYTVITLVAMAQYGRNAWRSRGETFSVWFGVLGRLAPFGLAGRIEDGLVHRRPFASGLAIGSWPVALVVLVALGTGSILYDGVSQTITFFDLFGIPQVPLGTLLLAIFLGVVVGLVLLVGRRVGMAAVGAGLVPVALGYLVAHYLTTLLIDGQRIAIALSDPFHQGWDLFGTAFWEPRTDWLPASIVWSVQVAAVVVGHVVGAWAGHAAAARDAAPGQIAAPGPDGVTAGPTTSPNGATASAISRSYLGQLPLAMLMVALTSATLWSLGQNLVFESGEGGPTADVRTVADLGWWEPSIGSRWNTTGDRVSRSIPG
jgi:hypothetical protein